MNVKPFGVRQSALLFKGRFVSVVLLPYRSPGSVELDLLKSTACVPLDSLEACERIVAQSVQAAAKWYSSASSRPVRVVVVRIEGSMVVEVLLNVDNGDVVFGKQLPNASGVGLLVSRNVVAVQESG